MKWDAVLHCASTVAAADLTLAALFPTIRLRGTGKHVVPSLEFFLVADGETEIWAPHTVQWNIFTESLEDLIAAERQLRFLFHIETMRSYIGMPMWSQWQDGETLATPDRDQFYGRAVRFVMTPHRERYEPAPTL